MSPGTLLLRQIHPAFVEHGRPTSQAFRPTPKDNGELSVYDGDLISAEKSWMHYTERLELQSAGVLAVTVAECRTLELNVRPDPEPFREHAVIVFAESGQRGKAKLLKKKAIERGWLYKPQ